MARTGAQPRWIWYPERRLLPNTFCFFRTEFWLDGDCQEATGSIAACSRYVLYVNGKRVQRGPAPFDPRFQELDPIDVGSELRPGRNCLGVLVCYFGHEGDGTYVPGNAGLRFELDVESDTTWIEVRSNASWRTHRATCWPAGQYRRNYLRAFQEAFDARAYPVGWDRTGFDDSGWQSAKELEAPPDLPVIVARQQNMLCFNVRYEGAGPFELRRRTIPFLDERRHSCDTLEASGWLHWQVPPEEFFEAYTENAFREERDGTGAPLAVSSSPYPLTTRVRADWSRVWLLALPEEMVGFPFVKVQAPAGTVVEILFGESRSPDSLLPKEVWPGQWVRLVTAENGVTDFEAFDWEAVRFLAILVRGEGGEARVLDVGVNRITYPFPQEADWDCSDAVLNRVYRGGINTVRNVSLETAVDNVARERQQYAGEVALTYLNHYLVYYYLKL